MPATLWSIKPSPWSVRIRWALKLLKFDFKVLSYPTVFLGEWRLRFLVRKWRVNVPVLVDKKEAIMGGMDIVAHAQAQNGAEGPKLVREGVEEWVAIADHIMENERARGLKAALTDTEALKQMVPCEIRWLFRLPFGVSFIRWQVRSVKRKYPKEYDEEELKAALAKLLVGIQASSSGYLLGDSLSFADVACATAIETVRGTPGKHVVILCRPHEGLACPLDDVLAWRDKMHAKHWVEGI